MMTIMDRSISYQINGLEKPQKISGFLKEKGYSRQNLVDLPERNVCTYEPHACRRGCSDRMDSGNG